METIQVLFLLATLWKSCLASNKGERGSFMPCGNINAPNCTCRLSLTYNLVFDLHFQSFETVCHFRKSPLNASTIQSKDVTYSLENMHANPIEEFYKVVNPRIIYTYLPKCCHRKRQMNEGKKLNRSLSAYKTDLWIHSEKMEIFHSVSTDKIFETSDACQKFQAILKIQY